MDIRGKLFSCYGCGVAACSMCAVYRSKTEREAVEAFIQAYGTDAFLNKVVYPSLEKKGSKWVRGQES